MTDCEWMFGDAATGLLGFQALAGFNPLRWSGSTPFEKAITDIRQAEKHKDRPVIVKVPSGVLSAEHRFETCQLAIDFLEKKDPTRARYMTAALASSKAKDEADAANAELARLNSGAGSEAEKAEAERRKKEADEKKQRAMEEALEVANDYLAEQLKFLNDSQEHADLATKELEAAKKAQIVSDVTANWMFGDAGKKTFGVQWAKNNPLRWSGVQPFDKTVQDLKAVEKDEVRPILMVAPSSDSKEEKQYATPQVAIDHLYELCPKHKQHKESIVVADTKKTEADARLGTLNACVADAENQVAKAKYALDPTAPKPTGESFPIKAICTVSAAGKPCGGGAETSVCTGTILLEQTNAHTCKITYDIRGLTAGKHGFHIHEKADFSDGCNSAGPHYNPYKKTHGAQEALERHVGDLGNIEPDANGVAKGVIVDSLVKLEGVTSVIGRSFMVHADEDDLGRGNNDEPGPPPVNGKASKATGNAGARIACGMIQKLAFPIKAICTVSAQGKACGGAEDTSECFGTITLEQTDADNCKITYEIKGLTAGKHGFHIHDKADFSDGCNSAGPHYNPHKKTHGAPGDTDRHVGDLGNVEPDADGIAQGEIWDKLIKLEGEFSVVGRSFMVHADEDDLGSGNNDEPGPPPVNGKASKATGNAGARIACGEIKHF